MNSRIREALANGSWKERQTQPVLSSVSGMFSRQFREIKTDLVVRYLTAFENVASIVIRKQIKVAATLIFSSVSEKDSGRSCGGVGRRCSHARDGKNENLGRGWSPMNKLSAWQSKRTCCGLRQTRVSRRAPLGVLSRGVAVSG